MKGDSEDKPVFTNQDVLEMFTNIPRITNNLIVDDAKRQKYDKFKKAIVNGTPLSDTQKVDKKSEDDLCPICLDDLTNGDDLDYCKYSCGKHIHLDCFNMWSKQKGSTCVFCRAKWTADTPVVGAYVNLAK